MNTGPQVATMRRISEMTETSFDGVAKPYVRRASSPSPTSSPCTGTGRPKSTR